MCASCTVEYVMEVLHIVSSDQLTRHLIRQGDQYAVIDPEGQATASWWMSEYETIEWAFIPSALVACHKMDRFIKGYFPEGLVTLVALEIS